MKQTKLFLSLLMLLTFSIGNVWGASPYSTNLKGTYDTKGGTISLNNVTWTYGSASYLAASSNAVQIGSKNKPQTDGWTITTDISNIGTNIVVTEVTIQAKTNGTGNYSIKVGSASATTGDLTTSDANYSATSLKETSGKIEITITGKTKAAYLNSISITYTTGSSTEPFLSVDKTEIDFGTVEQGADIEPQTVAVTMANIETVMADFETGCTAFSVSPTELSASGNLTITPNTSVAVGDYISMLTITDGEQEKAVSVKMNVIKSFDGKTWEINTTNFDAVGTGSSGYSKYDGSHTLSNFSYTSSNVMYQSNSLQFKASSGTLWNTTNFGKIVKIEITNQPNKSNNLTIYLGTSEKPTNDNGISVNGSVTGDVTTYKVTGDYGFVCLKNGNKITNITSIKVYYYPAEYAITIADCTNGSVAVTGITDLAKVEAGTIVTLTNAPSDGYKLNEYKVFKTDDKTTFVEVIDGKFTMPPYPVTISATFMPMGKLTGIELSGTYKTEFFKNEEFNHEGLIVTAKFDNGSDEDVTNNASFSAPDMTTTGTKTVTVSYTEGTTTKTATYEIEVKAYSTVAEILPLVPAEGTLETQVVGYISNIDEINITYKNATYSISDDGTRENELKVFRGKSVNKADFSSENEIEVGDKVVVVGNVTTYQGTKEFAANNYIKTLTKKDDITSVVVSGTPNKTIYFKGDVFQPTGLVATIVYKNGYSVPANDADIIWNPISYVVTESGNINVTATVNGIMSKEYTVAVTLSTKTLTKIELSQNEYTVYKGQELPKPIVMATYSEGNLEDVTALATFTGYDATQLGSQTITVHYTFGGEEQTAEYTVTVNSIANNQDNPYSVNEVFSILSLPGVDLTEEVYVKGIVTASTSKLESSTGKLTYYISDDGKMTSNDLTIYKGLNINGAPFENVSDIQAGEIVIIKGALLLYNGSTQELKEGNTLIWKKPIAIIHIENMTIEYGETQTIAATVTPTEAAKTIVYAIKSGDCITLNGNQLTAKSVAGTATVTATLETTDDYIGTSIDFKVTVVEPDNRKTATKKGFATGDNSGVHPFDVTDITFEAQQGDANNAPFIPNNSTNLRIYRNGGRIMIAALKGCKIDEVIITTTAEYNSTKLSVVKSYEEVANSKNSAVEVAKSIEYSFGKDMDADTIYLVCWGDDKKHLELSKIVVKYTGEPVALTKIEVTNAETEFDMWETFDHSTAVVTATYADNSTADVTQWAAFDEPDMETAGPQTVKVTYGGQETSYTITVKDKVLTSIKLEGDYQKRFTVNEGFNHDGLTVKALYNGTHDFDVTADASVSAPDLTTTGLKTVTVSYGGMTATYDIVVIEAGVVFYESFNTNEGIGGNDGKWNGVITGNLTYDYPNWECTAANGANQCAKFGSNNSKGSATTPAISAMGDFVITFKAGAWNSEKENVNLKLSVEEENGSLTQEYFVMQKGAWTEYMVALTGVTKDFKLTFSAVSTNNRFFLDEVKVLSVDYVRTGLNQITTTCLPKGVDAGSIFGATCYKLICTDEAVKNLTVESVDQLTAGMPYVLEPTADFFAVRYNNEAEVTAGNERHENGLYGTISPISNLAQHLGGKDGIYVIVGNKVYKCGDNVGIPTGNRAWIKMTEVPGPAQAAIQRPGSRRVTMGNGSYDGGQVTTGDIDNVTIEHYVNGTYDVLGRKIAQPMGAGFYIVNGKKVIVNK